MNERIRELKKQAWTLVSIEERDRGELYQAQEQWERCDQKFAELIVLECAKLRHKNVVVGGVSDYNRGRRELAEEILKHFGVEE